jgi:hypothetical protein
MFAFDLRGHYTLWLGRGQNLKSVMAKISDAVKDVALILTHTWEAPGR